MHDLLHHAPNNSQLEYYLESSNELAQVFFNHVLSIVSAISEFANWIALSGDNNMPPATSSKPSLNLYLNVVSV